MIPCPHGTALIIPPPLLSLQFLVGPRLYARWPGLTFLLATGHQSRTHTARDNGPAASSHDQT